jgi:putative PIN family toxin of toxin-antitoxin system
MKAVLDANVFISAVLVPYGRPAQILQAWRDGRFELVISPPILAEIRRVLLYPRLQRKHGWEEADINAFLDGLRTTATIVPGHLEVTVVRDDPTDDKYVGAAVEADAAYIVSGDEHLKTIERYQGIIVLSPAAFLRSVLNTPIS